VRTIRVGVVATGLALVFGITGCSGPSITPATQGVDLSRLYWVVSQSDLAFIQTADPQIATRMLDGPSTYVLTEPSNTSAAVPSTHAVPTMLFTSYSIFISTLRDKAIRSDIRAVAYDPEFWPATPRDEQQNPLRYMDLFAIQARRSGYQPILVPGRDLALAPGGQCAKQQSETLNAAYLRCGIADAARFAPVFEIQCAPDELDIAELRSFVAASVRQAHAANPSAVLIATLSTTPNGVHANSADLVRAAQAIAPIVRGFQLNMTSATRWVAVDFLRAISGTGS
jgi:hypothetical protein